MARPKGIPAHNKQSLEKIKERIFEVHGDVVSLREETYIHMREKCIFIDSEYGEWLAYPNNVISKGTQHPKRGEYKRRQTWKSIYENKEMTESIQNKIRLTNLRRYGKECIFDIPRVRKAMIESKTKYRKKDFDLQKYDTVLEDFIDTKPPKGFGLIYRATSPTNRVYYGKTTRSLFKRILQHIKDANIVKEDKTYLYNSKFSRSIRKYSANKLKWEIVEYLPEKDLDMREKFFICFDNTYKCGLNSTLGGDGGSPMLGKKNSPETIAKRIKSVKEYYEKKRHSLIKGGF